MKLIIEIPEEDYKHGMLGLYFDCYSVKLHDTILNGTPIPDNATNGDVIKAMFSVEIVDDFCHSFGFKLNNSNYIQFNKDWWNAPYQKGGKG